MSVTIRIDTSKVAQNLDALAAKQIPFALSLAINRLGEQGQQAERQRFAQVFTERRKDFLEREGVKRLGPAATKNNPSVTFGPSARADFLFKFEQGGQRPTRSGSIMIPVDAKRNKKDIVNAANRPRALIANKTSKGAGGVFLLTTQRGKLAPGLYQRTGRGGRGGVKLLFAREQKAIIPPSLHFVQTFSTIAKNQWATTFDAALKQAIATAK